MRVALLAGILLVTVPLVGCADDGGGPGDGDDVTEQVAALDNEFDPDTMSLPVNGMIEWTNEGENPHTVEVRMQGGDTLLSEEIQPGEMTSFVFEVAGTYDVWCDFHGGPGQGMAMTVTVE